jgi:hypothetical protein
MNILEFFQQVVAFFLLIISFACSIGAVIVSSNGWFGFLYGLVFVLWAYCSFKLARYPFVTTTNSHKFWVW